MAEILLNFWFYLINFINIVLGILVDFGQINVKLGLLNDWFGPKVFHFWQFFSGFKQLILQLGLDISYI